MVQQIGKELDMIQLSIFSHRFMSIAEQMGRYARSITFEEIVLEIIFYLQKI